MKMSKERELLKKWMKDCMWRGSNMSLLEETKELLANPKPLDLNISEFQRGYGAALSAVRKQPIREEYLGGQTYKYIQLGETIDSIKVHFGVDDEH
jgi:hypothetical protein